jgi:predicted nucleic acid-binding protein
MIVVDASVVAEALIHGSSATDVKERLLSAGDTLHAPHLIDLEIAQVARKLVRSRRIVAERGHELLGDFVELGLIRHPHHPFLARIWELRDALSAYDAAYVALAESLDSPLVTHDSKLARSRGHHARIELL